MYVLRLYFGFDLAVEPQHDPKRRTLARCAFHADAAIHGLCQTRANGQTQSCAAKRSRSRTICLNKGPEQSSLSLGWNAGASVFDLKTRVNLRFCFCLSCHADGDFAGIRKLDSVANQI